MKFLRLVNKELKSIRLQGIVFAVVLMFFGSSSILMQKFIPQLVPENMAEYFEPSLKVGLADFVGNSLQIGAIVVILITVAALAGEREANTLELLLSRPVSKLQIVLSKFVTRVVYIMGGVIVSGFFGWYYTVYVFEPFSVGKILLSSVVIGFVLSFVASLTLIFSSFLVSKIAAAMWSGAISLLLAILATLKPPFSYLSPFEFGTVAREVLLEGVSVFSLAKNVLIIVGFTALCLAISMLLFSRSEKIT